MVPFEERLQRLEQIGEALRHGSQPIDEAMNLFQEGVTLARNLEGELSKIERHIEILVNEPERDGSDPILRPFSDDDRSSSPNTP